MWKSGEQVNEKWSASNDVVHAVPVMSVVEFYGLDVNIRADLA
jgi:hypothetical protein